MTANGMRAVFLKKLLEGRSHFQSQRRHEEPDAAAGRAVRCKNVVRIIRREVDGVIKVDFFRAYREAAPQHSAQRGPTGDGLRQRRRLKVADPFWGQAFFANA